METKQLMHLMELMFQKSYYQGQKDNNDGVHICPKELYRQFKDEYSELFTILSFENLHSDIDNSNLY